jgi:Ser/Thr protein kinase RdoA (MazF antagonist)
MQHSPFSTQQIQSILSHWDIDKTVHTSPHQGLINHTFLIGHPMEGVLQWVNPIFDAKIHTDIAALTKHLRQRGMISTELLPTKNGALYINHKNDESDENGGYWRILRFIKGLTYDQIPSPILAFEAGKLVGSFHNALVDFDHTWQAPFRDSHNTTARMNTLSKALNEYNSHPLYDEAYTLGSQILKDWGQWSGSLDLPIRVCHGDLKISNLHFNEDGTGCCLLDLDTIGPGDYSIEMGDAWRSWCNPAGESNPEEAHFNLDLFEASAKGWFSTVGDISSAEQAALVSGIHRICLELSARFCADALQNTYFKEDRSVFPNVGQHNLYRATTQYRLSQSVLQNMLAAEKIVQSLK